MKQIQLCDYGCGQLATYQFKSGKWCCESNTHRCPSQRIINSKTHIGIPSVKKGKKYKNTKHNFEEIKTSKLCDYGCGNIAKYKFDNKKIGKPQFAIYTKFPNEISKRDNNKILYVL